MGINKDVIFRLSVGIIFILIVIGIILACFFGGAKLGCFICEGLAERIRNTFNL